MKSAFIVIKASFVIYKTLKAAKVWYKSDMPMGKPSAFVLILSAFTIMMGAVYKFSKKRIFPLFLLQSLGNYCAFCVLHVLIGYVQNKQSQERRAQICKQLKIIHVLWWISAFYASKHSLCSRADFYPWIFILNLVIFALLFVFVHLKAKQGFKLKWNKDEEIAKKLFEAQIDRYYKSTRFVLLWHVVEVALGKLLDTFSN